MVCPASRRMQFHGAQPGLWALRSLPRAVGAARHWEPRTRTRLSRGLRAEVRGKPRASRCAGELSR